jgi:hypothetical protein
VGNDKYSYSSDYDIISKLKSFTDTTGICLLLVHHTRKQPSIVAIVAIVASQQFAKWRSRREFPAIKGAWGGFPNKAKQAISKETEIACFCKVGTALPSLRLLYRV